MKKIALFIFMVAILFSIVSCSLPNNNSNTSKISNSSYQISTSSEDQSEDSSNTTSEPVENGDASTAKILDYLKEYRFIKDDEAEIGLKDSVKRSTALTIVMRLSNVENYSLRTTWDSGENAKHTYTDIADSDPISSYASCAMKIGFIEDNGDHLFRGDENIKANEFVTWLLRALGYDDSSKHFDSNSPWELSDYIGLTNGEYNESQAFLFEDLLKCSFSALKTIMKNDTTGLYYYSFVYKRFDVDYPEIFHENTENYIKIDRFASNLSLEVNNERGGTIHFSGEPNELMFVVLDPSIVSFKFKDSNVSESKKSTQRNFNVKALKKGSTTIKITFKDEQNDYNAIAFIDVIVK